MEMNKEVRSKPVREIAEYLLLKTMESRLDNVVEEEWSWKDLLNTPINWAFGVNNLALGAAMEFFGILQRQIFVKDIIYKTLDFVALEMEVVAYRSLHISELLTSQFKDDVIEKCINQWKDDRYSNIFDYHHHHQEGQKREGSEGLEEVVSEESFRSVLTYIRGNFAMDLAKNLVDLLTFRQRQSLASLLFHPISWFGFHLSSSSSFSSSFLLFLLCLFFL